MTIHPLVGHREARRRVARSLEAGRLPQVILVTGPEGIGKQRFGLWLAQLLFCAAPSHGEPCGSCRACHLVLGLTHSDLHWFIPVARPKAGDQDKQVEEAAELLADAVAARRSAPLYSPPDGMHLHSMASARLLLRRAALTSVEGGPKFFLVGDADRLVAQEGGDAAANALLKFLEEPPADTRVVLTATEADRVLPTIRSRATPLRLAPLPEAEVRQFAGASEWKVKAEAEARAILEAVEARGAARFERSLKQGPWQARGGFTDMLDALAAELSVRARGAAARGAAAPYATALARVQEARTMAQGNVNPQLLLAALTSELAAVL